MNIQKHHSKFTQVTRLAALSIALLPLLTTPAFANQGQRPKVGLVLGGGGARGAAHVGVIKKLEELNVQVDCLAGTSMGGLVAGAYSTGLNAEQMRKALADADWRDMFNDSPDYNKLTQRNKEMSQAFIPGLEAGVKNGSLRFPPAVLGGQKIKFFINQLIGADKTPQFIENQQLPLSLVATNIVTGQRMVYKKGDLASVMRATMSVPGLLAPVKYEGSTLVDGGLVDNVPISEVKETCHPDVVIAVNVGSPLLKEEEIESSPLSVTAQTLNLLTEQNVTQSLALLSKDVDIYIKPDLDGISAADFEKNADAIERGYKAATLVEAKLKALSTSNQQYAAWRQSIQPRTLPAPIIDSIEVVNNNPNTLDVRKQLSQKEGEPLNTEQLEDDLLHVYGDGNYSGMDYQLINNHDRTTLRVFPAQKAWGPNYVRSGINFSWDNKGNADYNLRLGYHMTQLNKQGGELLVAGQLGSHNRLGLNYYQPLSHSQRWFTETNAIYSDQSVGLYQNGKDLAKYKTSTYELNTSVGYNVARYGSIKAGISQRWQNANLSIGSEGVLPNSKSNSTFGWFARTDFDRTNRLYFPTKGWIARAHYYDTSDYSKLSTELQGFYSIKDFVFSGKVAYINSPKGELPVNDAAYLGGINHVAGLSNQQIIGDNSKYAGLRVERIIGKMPLGIRGDLRLGLAAEMADMKTRYSETQGNGWTRSGTAYLGGETPLGPVYLGVSKANHNSTKVYLFIGTP